MNQNQELSPGIIRFPAPTGRRPWDQKLGHPSSINEVKRDRTQSPLFRVKDQQEDKDSEGQLGKLEILILDSEFRQDLKFPHL